MVKIINQDGNLNEFKKTLASLDADERVKSIVILACDKNGYKKEWVDDSLKVCRKPIIGGIFPQIVIDHSKLEKGFIAVGLNTPMVNEIIGNLSMKDIDLDEVLSDKFSKVDMNHKTMFVFVDGLSKGIASLNEAMFNNWGILCNYVGGGAGSLSFVQGPCIFTNEGLLEDAAVLGLVDIRSGVGVAHGWKPISEPLRVTEVDRNKIISINWEPAFDVYQNIVETSSGKSFKEMDFFELAKGYPLGISVLADEVIVRDPISVDNGTLTCVGEIPQGSNVRILTGSESSLLAGAELASEKAKISYLEENTTMDKKDFITLFIDCISRVLYLDDRFYKELECVNDGHELIGILSLGEIANTGKAYLEFYNKTSVVALLEKKYED
jgi:hypothetical protein